MIARLFILLGLSLPLTLGLLMGIVVVGSHRGRDPVYTVTAVRTYLSRDPGRWVGRTILIRGEVVPCLAMPIGENGRCAVLARTGQPRPGADAAGDRLPLAYAGLDPFLALIRSVPILGGLVSAPQVLQWGTPVTYRIRLRASTRGTGACCDALLLDAAP